MRRRLIMLVGSFLVILLAVMVVKWSAADDLTTRDTLSDRSVDYVPRKVGAPSMEAGADKGTWARWQSRNPDTHRLEGIYIMPEWHKRDDGNYVAYNPCIEMRQEDGQRIYITADQAVLRVEDVGGGMKVLGGRMYSTDPDNPLSVRIYLDRSPDADRPSFTELGRTLGAEEIFAILDQRSEDMVRIYVADMSFNEDLLEIVSQGDVRVHSPEVDISGTGMVIQWNEEPNELRLFRITDGGTMWVKNIPSDVNLLAMPGTEGAAITPETVDESPDSSADQAGDQSDGQPAEDDGLAASDEPTDIAAVAPPVVPDAPPADDVAAVEAEPSAAADDDAEKIQVDNIYQAVFNGSVRVVSGEQRLWGADVLTLQFEWGGTAEDDADQSAGESTADTEAGAAPAPDASQTADGPPADGGVASPDDQAAAKPPEKKMETVIISWSGELSATPVGYTADPSPRRYEMTAVGNTVHLEDPQASASCNVAKFFHPDKRGQLIGTQDNPARMYLAGGQEIISPELTFDLPSGKVNLAGPGMILQASEAPDEQGPGELPQLGSLSDAGSISWGGRVEATFGTRDVMGDDGKMESRQYIKDARFWEDVVLTQGPADESIAWQGGLADEDMPAGEFLRCDEMRVWMSGGEDGSVAPDTAVAVGNVIARQGASLIRAKEVTIWFDEVEEIDDDEQVVTRLRPAQIVASGGVRITDTSNPDQPIEARAERVQSYVQERKAILFGGPSMVAADIDPDATHRDNVLAGKVGHAEIVQGDRRLSGMEIHLDQDTQSAVVIGEGHMRLFTDTGLSGAALAESRPVNITWRDEMRYYGKKNDANFFGDVELTSEMDSMTCQRLRVLFEKSEPDEPEEDIAAADADEADDRSRRLGLNIERYSQRRLSMIMAFGDVVVRSRSENEQGQLLQRMQLTGERLMYDLPVRELSVFGNGTLVAEDYDVPQEDDAAAADEETSDDSGSLEAPSQTAFLWTKEMRLMQLARQVTLSGDVQMIHRSGDQVVLMPGLNVPAWSDLESGRKSSIRCEELFAEFAKPSIREVAASAISGDMLESGPGLGPLELFTAYRKVKMVDGPVQITGEQLTYDRRNGSAVVLGFLENQRPSDASLLYEDPETGDTRVWSSPKMIIDIKDGEITKVHTGQVTGSGGVRPGE